MKKHLSIVEKMFYRYLIMPQNFPVVRVIRLLFLQLV